MFFERRDESRVVTCRGCGGTGQHGPRHPLDFPRDCSVCAGIGKVRMEPEDSWCGRCQGSGKERIGIPGFQTLRNCHICGGAGIIQV